MDSTGHSAAQVPGGQPSEGPPPPRQAEAGAIAGAHAGKHLQPTPNATAGIMASDRGSDMLEDRLRSMVLKNEQKPSPLGSQSPEGAPLSSNIHMLPHGERHGDQHDNQHDQQRHDELQYDQRGQLQQNLAKIPKKRPNQAQRRQMSTQLSISFDPRPPLPQTARSFVSPTANGLNASSPAFPAQSSHSQYHNHNQPHHKSNRPHSATFRPPGYSPYLDSNVPSPGLWRGSARSPGQFPGGHHYHGPALPFDTTPLRTVRGQANTFYNPRAAPGHSSTRSEGQFLRQILSPAQLEREDTFLSQLVEHVLSKAQIEPKEIAEKESFRLRIETIFQRVIAHHELELHPGSSFPPASVQLKCFGSLASGFATKASDMDLGLFSPQSSVQPDESGSPIPRLLEKALLDAGLGARLITRTRVPIIKLCEKPTGKFRRDLIEERTKWENGMCNDNPDGMEEDPLDEHHHDLVNGAHADMIHSPETGGENDPEQYARKLEALVQQPNQALQSYHNHAKRVLRRLGGRDIRHANASELTVKDLEVLRDVCRQYIQGLYNPTLRDSLFAYRSLSFPEPVTAFSPPRSLMGVGYQVEGEILLAAWETREFREKDARTEKEAWAAVNVWKDLQQRDGNSIEPLTYTKDLERSLHRLGRIPSLQLKILDQGSDTATEYYERAKKLLSSLGGHDDTSCPINLSKFVECYVTGIHNEQIRTPTSAFLQTLPVKLLSSVAHRHKTLHLALDYERAVEKGLYDDQQAAVIRQYVQIIRGPMKPSAKFGYIIPLDVANESVLRAIKTFPDPSSMACNQPRDQYRDKLEFPPIDVGVQCDINFSAHLAMQNTILLRCFCHTDPRVRPLVIFVKHWAKKRNINEAYRGTLNSYGYVLMMLHYLVNIAEPFVCPNLQELAPAADPRLPQAEVDCKGRDVRFWRDEADIKRLASQNMLNKNHDSTGSLLSGFFEYFAQGGLMRNSKHRGFDWGRDVISLRTHGGLLSKQHKGWTGAKTVIQKMPANRSGSNTNSSPASAVVPAEHVQQDGSSASNNMPKAPSEFKEVRHRYLFAIEDPFELDHNVARTVTHNGIVSIRDEFRRAWRLIQDVGRGNPTEDLLLGAKDKAAGGEQARFAALLAEIHGDGKAVGPLSG